MHIVLGNDHAGFPLKDRVHKTLTSLGHEVTYVGNDSSEEVDFPDVARKVTDAVLDGGAERGVMVCGSGVGAGIAANKVPGIRAAVAHEPYSAAQGVEHDDVNVLCLGAWLVGPLIVDQILAAFTAAEFSTSPEFRRRVEKLSHMEQSATEAGTPRPVIQ